MNPIALIVVLVGGGWLLSTFTTANAVSRLEYLIGNIEFSFQNIFNLKTAIQVLIQNPTSSSFDINSLAGSIYLNGEYLGNVSSFEKTVVHGNEQTPYTVTLTTNVFALSTELQSLIKSFHGIDLNLKGTINVNGTGIPIDINYKVM